MFEIDGFQRILHYPPWWLTYFGNSSLVMSSRDLLDHSVKPLTCKGSCSTEKLSLTYISSIELKDELESDDEHNCTTSWSSLTIWYNNERNLRNGVYQIKERCIIIRHLLANTSCSRWVALSGSWARQNMCSYLQCHYKNLIKKTNISYAIIIITIIMII